MPETKDPKEKESKEEMARGIRAGSGGITLEDSSITRVTLEPERKRTSGEALNVAIRNRVINFEAYRDFIDRVLCENQPGTVEPCCGQDDRGERKSISEDSLGAPTLKERRADLIARPTIQGVDAYNLLKFATEVFLLLNAGLIRIVGGKATLYTAPDLADEAKRLDESPAGVASVIETLLQKYFGGAGHHLPYLDRIVQALTSAKEGPPFCEELLQYRLSCPSMIELIWSYWHEEGMLVQTLNAVALRFQNRRGADRDPLAQLEIDPLRPLNNLLWGYIQDEPNRLTVVRRAYEYDHHYGITLFGKAVPQLRSADSRSRFIESFHNLLYRSALYYRESSDTTVIPDGFPLLNALKETHLILAEGAHNQFGDLPWTARVEMLIQQWLLHRPEMREFLRGRYMVPYKEPWMGQVDAMKKLQGWTDVTVTHFHDLAVYGEQILLAVRYGNWIDVNDQDEAKNWAEYWRPEIQAYIHAYRAASGADLSEEPVDISPPWVHLRTRAEAQRRRTQSAI